MSASYTMGSSVAVVAIPTALEALIDDEIVIVVPRIARFCPRAGAVAAPQTDAKRRGGIQETIVHTIFLLGSSRGSFGWRTRRNWQ